MSANFPFRTSGVSGTGVAPAKEPAETFPEKPVNRDFDRESRIASLRDRYRTGKYSVDSLSVAACIVDHHLELPSKS